MILTTSISYVSVHILMFTKKIPTLWFVACYCPILRRQLESSFWQYLDKYIFAAIDNGIIKGKFWQAMFHFIKMSLLDMTV